MSSRYLVSRVRFIAAAPDRIFEILATPAMHSEIDGSGTVRGARPKGPGRLGPGAKFGMEMNIRVNYRILNRDARHIRGKFLLGGLPAPPPGEYR
jgi:hypothetical protein